MDDEKNSNTGGAPAPRRTLPNVASRDDSGQAASGRASANKIRDIIASIRPELFGLPVLPDPAPEGKLFLETAINRTKERLLIAEGPAIKRVLEAIRTEEIRTWMRGGPNGRRKIPAADWQGAHLDLDEFYASGSGGIVFKGSTFHLHRFFIAADDFEFWLNTAAPRGQIVIAEHARNARPREPAPLGAQRYPENLPPTKPILLAFEVLAWITFRRAIPFSQFSCLWRGQPGLERSAQELAIRAALVARARIETDYYCCI